MERNFHFGYEYLPFCYLKRHTAFEIAFGLDKTYDKNKVVENMDEPEFKEEGKKGKGSILSRRIWFLCNNVANFISEDKLSETKKSIAAFVKLRNDITHNGKWEWGDCGLFSTTLVKTLYILIAEQTTAQKHFAII